jgi:Mce-associated membrane protein
MAKHAGTDGELNNSPPSGETGHESIGGIQASTTIYTQRRGWLTTTLPIIVSVSIVAALGCLTAWLGWRTHEAHAAQQQRNLFVEVARQAAVNLATISYTEVDADLQRILDSSTGSFYDEFKQRAGPFGDVVKQAQSKSRGTVTAASLESEAGDHGQVLVSMSVTTTTKADASEQQPRAWRMRVEVQRVSGSVKVSDVQFVP